MITTLGKAINAFTKILLLAIGAAPFLILAGNAFRRITFNFVYAVLLSTIAGAVFYCCFGAGRHPHVSSIFSILFVLWPPALIAAKVLNPSISWTRLWISVPFMSWFTCTTAVAVDYPVNGAGGGLGMLVTLVASWFYMIPIFGLLFLVYALIARHRSTQTDR